MRGRRLAALLTLLALGTMFAGSSAAAPPPEPSISIGDVSLPEGTGGTTAFVFTATLSEATSKPVSVAYQTANGTATSPSDYAEASGKLSFAGGETTKTVTVQVNGDAAAEADETFFVNLSDPKSATIGDGQGVGTIVNDDTQPGLSINDISLGEGNGGTTNAVFTVSLSAPAPPGGVTFDVATADGTASSPSDYTATSVTGATIPAGSSLYSFTVPVVGDMTFEGNETFLANVMNVVGATLSDGQGEATIVNDDAPPGGGTFPTLSIDDVTHAEGNTGTTAYVFTVTLSPATNAKVTVNFATEAGTASPNVDYQPASGTLTFKNGQTSKEITVMVNGDETSEPDETFFVRLANAVNATIGDDTGLGTIEDDDNDPPVADAQSVSVAEDDSVTITLTGSDPEGDPITFTIETLPANGSLYDGNSVLGFEITTVPFMTAGVVTYAPDANFNGGDSFTFATNDGEATSSPATVSITVTPVNDAPVAVADSYSTDEDVPLVVAAGAGVLANDSDVDGDALSAVLVSGPSDGALTLNADGSFTYTPAADFNGGDSFSYKANDGSLDSNVATVTLTVDAVNDAPVAVADSYSTDEDVPLVVASAAGVLANDSDVDGDALSAVLVSGPSHGALTLNADGSFTYTPAADFNGGDSFTYTANDGTVDSNVATVTLTVDPVNDAPVAVDDTYATDTNGAASDTAPGVLGNDTDVDGDTLTAILVSGPANADSFTLNSDGSFNYQAASGATGTDSFTYKANDGALDSNVATVTITLNTPPVANDDAYSVDEDTTLTADGAGGNPVGVLANDTDGDGDTLTASLVDNVANGTLSLNADGTFTYAPDADFAGEDSFTYTANDGIADSNTATVTITVNAVNDAPVLANVEAGALSYTENDPATAITSTLTVSDVDSANLAGATVQITGNYNSGQDVLAFADTATITGSFNAATGTLTLSGTDSVANYESALQAVTYANSSDNPSTATRTVSFQVDDGSAANNLSNVATRDIAITAVNDAPVLAGVELSALAYAENDPATAITSTITVSDVDSANLAGATVQITGNYTSGQDVLAFASTATITGSFNAATGTLTLTGSDTVANYQAALRAVTYANSSDDPSAATRTVSFQVDDGAAANNLSTIVTRDITITPVNDAPVATAKTLTTHSSIRVTIDGAATGKLLEGATDADDPTGELTVGGTFTDITPAGGAVELIDATTGAYRFNPPAGYSGPASFKFTVCDDGSPVAPQMCSPPATVTITITGPDLWFVDGSAGTTGTGRLTDPFDSPADLPAGRGTGDRIFVFSGSYATGHTLNGSEHLIGQAATGTTFDALLGVQVPGNGTLDTRPSLSGAAVTLQNTVTLASSGKVQGVTISSGANIGLAGSGGLIGVDVSQTSVTTTTGTALSLNNVAGTLSLTNVSKNGAGTGVSLTSVNAAVTIAAGTIQNTTTGGVVIDGGSGSFSFAGSLSSISSGRAAQVQNKAASASVSFTGAVGSLAAPLGGTGILLDNNDQGGSGGGVTFSGGVNLSTGASAAFAATNGGTVAVTGATNTLATTTGTALNVANTTIGGSGLTFRSIASNGAASGIVLNNTGSGSLVVTGDGGTCSSVASCTGGAIQNSTNAAISLTSTTSPSFTRIAIQNAARSGIDGQQVTNFTLANSFIDNVGTAAAGQYDESNLAFNDNGSFTSSSLSGVVSITNNTLTNARRHGIQIENGSGTIGNLTISNNTLMSSTNAAVSLGTAILVLIQGSAATTAHLTTGTISANTLTGFPSGEGIAVLGGSGNASNNTSATLGANGTPISITGNAISGGTGASRMGSNAIRVSFNGNFGVSNFSITNNGTAGAPITNIEGQGISGFMGGTVTGTTTISGNFIVANQTLAAGTQGLAVQVDDGPAALNTSAADYNFVITSNSVSNYEGSGIRAIARASLGKMDVTIQNNTVGTPILANRNGIRIDSGSSAGDVTLCLSISGNTSDGSGVNQGIGLRKQGTVATTNDFGIVGLSPSPTTGANAAAKVAADNPAGGGVDIISGDNFVSCTITP